MFADQQVCQGGLGTPWLAISEAYRSTVLLIAQICGSTAACLSSESERRVIGLVGPTAQIRGDPEVAFIACALPR